MVHEVTPELTARLYAVKRDIEDIVDSLEAAPETVPSVTDSRKLAVIVGHSERSPGAFAGPPIGQNEYFWNRDLARRMQDCADRGGRIGLAVFHRDRGGIAGAYGRAGEWGADAAIELHFNAAGVAATGTETLFVTEISKGLARAVQNAMTGLLDLRDRGVKEPWEGRGRQSLTRLAVPSVIVEPFFGSNPGDRARAAERKDGLARVLVEAAAAVLSA